MSCSSVTDGVERRVEPTTAGRILPNIADASAAFLGQSLQYKEGEGNRGHEDKHGGAADQCV